MKTFLNYIATDIFQSISFRMFQVYCTWLFVQELSNDVYLSIFLIVIWGANVITLPLAGIVADKIKSSYILLFSSISATCLSLFILLYINGIDRGEYYYLFLFCGLILSTLFSLINPVSISVISKIFQNTESVAKAYKIKSSVWVINIVFGPTFSGLLIATIGAKIILFFCLLLYCLSFLFSLSFFYKFKNYDSARYIASSSSRRRFFFNELLEVFHITYSIKEERMIALSSVLANLVFVPFVFLLLPIIIINTHHMGMLEVGLVELAMGLGILFSNLFFIRWIDSLYSKHISAFLGILSIAISLFIFSITYAFFIMIFCGFLMGVGLNTFNVTVNTRRVSCIPDGYRSRMEGLLIFACTISIPAGLLLSKFYLDKVLPNHIVLASSLLIFLSSILILRSQALKEMLLTEHSPYYQLKYPRLFTKE